MVDNVLVPMPVLNIDQQGQCFARAPGDKRKLTLIYSFQTKKLVNIKDGVRISRGCFIPGDRLLLSQYECQKLSVCKFDGSNSTIIDLDYYPESIILYENNHALLSTGGESIQIINLSSLQHVRSIIVGGRCLGMTIVKEKIWVKNQPNTLTIVDINGKVLNTTKTTFNPYYICANKDGDVYCTDCHNSNKVFLVTSDGKEREIYNSPDLKTARGVAVDDRGDVYVAGNISNNLHRISNNGQKHDIPLTADDGINGPTELSYNCGMNELLVMLLNSPSARVCSWDSIGSIPFRILTVTSAIESIS
ncbi:unnamed protein product [Mytilus coruscus]|uniref:Uncharacterized protein n=1 Tax=Mytilus coruscus TaxID=42192 RepID=A0A6J8CWZ6_MYTCO|nr:unnamed protein product [Mytilus coruscus]